MSASYLKSMLWLHESGIPCKRGFRIVLGVVYMNFKLNSCLHGRLSWGLKDHMQGMKISFRIETHFRFMYQQSYFSGDFSTCTLKYVNKTSHFANNLYFGHNERRFYSDFHSGVKFQFKFTWFRIDISFRIEYSIRNEKWNELDPKWVATQSGFI